MDRPLLFCFGTYSPLGPISVSIEWRDYVLGLEQIGSPVGVIDMFNPEDAGELVGFLAAAMAIRRLPAHRSLLDQLTRLETSELYRLTEDIPQWLTRKRGRSPSDRDNTGRSPLGFLRSLPQPMARRLKPRIALTWNHICDLLTRRAESAADLREARRLSRLTLSPSRPHLREATRVAVVVDFYDAGCWGGGAWKRAVEERVKASLTNCSEIHWIARAVTESSALPADRLRELKYFDEIWVPSEFHLPLFRKLISPTKKVVKIPECIDTSRFAPGSARTPIAGRRHRAFLSLSNYAPPSRRSLEWNSVRKATDITIRAFLTEFDLNEDICLIIKGHSDKDIMRSILAKLLRQWKVPQERLNQILVLGLIPNEDLPSLYSSVDAVIGVARAEGWGRPLMEAMAVGTPAVATRFGGNLEFMNDSNSYLVDAKLVPVSRHLPYLRGWGKWAEPSVEHLGRIMRQIYQNPAAAKVKTKSAVALVRRYYSREAVARLMRRAAKSPLRTAEPRRYRVGSVA